MNNCQISMYKILSSALNLFRQRGYSHTSIRQIADASSVSLGLVNHYFTSKRILAGQSLSLLQEFLGEFIQSYVDVETNPLLYDAVGTRVQNTFLLNGEFRQFYLDILQEGIFLECIMQYPVQVLTHLRKAYSFSGNEDYILLFNRYIPCDIEKILVLQKEAGKFPNISYEDIPFLICSAALERFVPAEEITRADQASRILSPKILEQLPPYPPEEFIQTYLCNLGSIKREQPPF